MLGVMGKAITKERWMLAQQEERKQHVYDYETGYNLYKHSYRNYEKYIGLKPVDGVVIEIGCADFPALQHYPATTGIVIEPMPSVILEDIARACGITVIKIPVEEMTLVASDEIWLMNVMQHIIDPELFVSKCKDSAEIIRYFEPVDYPTCLYHPHSYTLQDFKNWFGDAKRYTDKVPHFHQADCAYGVWKR